MRLEKPKRRDRRKRIRVSALARHAHRAALRAMYARW